MTKRFTKQLTSAVSALHTLVNDELVIHRDIKMENILFEIKSNSEPILKWGDFGCAVIIKSGERISEQKGTLSKIYKFFEC